MQEMGRITSPSVPQGWGAGGGAGSFWQRAARQPRPQAGQAAFGVLCHQAFRLAHGMCRCLAGPAGSAACAYQAGGGSQSAGYAGRRQPGPCRGNAPASLGLASADDMTAVHEQAG